MSLYLLGCIHSPMNYQLNDGRIERVLNAKTLDEATKMGLWDRIKDYFQGGAKAESIRRLYEQVTSYDNDYDAQPLRVVDRFSMLRSLAKEEYQTEFCVNIKETSDDAWQWKFHLQIGERIIFQSEVFDKRNDNNFDKVATIAKCIDFLNTYNVQKKNQNLSLEAHIQSRIECMSDDRSVQETLRQCLDDARFSSDEFIKTEPHDDKSKFIAHFKRGDLILSNRKSDNYEYRGEILQNILKENSFTNLKSLLSEDYGTEKDNLLCYIATPSKFELINMLGSETDLSSERVRAVAYSQKVANTTVGALWGLASVSGNADKDAFSVDNGRSSGAVSVRYEQLASRYEKNNLDWAAYYGRSDRDNGRKTALNAVSYLVTSLAGNNDTPTLTMKDLNEINRLIKEDRLTFYDVKTRAVNQEDLKLIRKMALNGITGLVSDRPSAGLLLKYLDNFIKETDVLWASTNENNQERLFDQEARRDFNRDALIGQLLDAQSAADKAQMLENMEGKFGQRLRGVVEFAAEKVGQNEDDPVLISTAYKYHTVMDDLIITLRNQLGKDEAVVGNGEDVRRFDELTESEIQALAMVGMQSTILE